MSAADLSISRDISPADDKRIAAELAKRPTSLHVDMSCAHGGDHATAIRIHDTLTGAQSRGCKVSTHNVAYLSGASLVAYLGGEARSAAGGSFFSFAGLRNDSAALIAKRCGQAAERVRTLIATKATLTAEEARAIGLCGLVVDSPQVTNVRPTKAPTRVAARQPAKAVAAAKTALKHARADMNRIATDAWTKRREAMNEKR